MKTRPQKQSLGNAKKAQANAGQFLKHIWNYPIQAEWDTILDKKKSFSLKMTVLVERLNLIGCTHPDEQTLKWLLALLLAACYDELPSHTVIRQKLIDLKALVESERKPWYLEYIAEFPKTPDGLSTAIKNHAYGDAPAVPKQFEGINAIGEQHIPLRANSKLLKKSATGANDPITWRDLVEMRSQSPPARPRSEPAAPSSVHTVPARNMPCAPPDDEEELELYFEYQRKLLALRRMRSAGVKLEQVKAEAPTASEPSTGCAPMTLVKSADGTFVLTPKTRSIPSSLADMEPTKVEVKDEPSAKQQAAVGDEMPVIERKSSEIAETDEKSAGIVDPLDAHAKAAIDAFRARKAGKAAAKSPAVTPIVKKGKAARKKPAAAMPKAPKKAPVPKAAAAAKVKVEISKKKIGTSMPTLPSDGSAPEPVRYNGGVIYSSGKDRKFRVLTTAGDKYSEKGSSWKGPTPTKESWLLAIKHIDDARAGA